MNDNLTINRLFDGFYGKLTSSKWAKLTKCSQDTALRDIKDLLERQILIKDEAGGRSTSYQLNENYSLRRGCRIHPNPTGSVPTNTKVLFREN